MEEQAQLPRVDMVEELARREQQLEVMRQAYQELMSRVNGNTRDSMMKTINSLPTFTGTGDITVNSFFSNIEYLLSTINNAELMKEAVRTIFYRIIQGPAKDAIINLPEPDNWQLIKETLKLRYRPSVEPYHLYKKIANLKVNNVSELMLELQDIKYKTDELIVYYRGDHYIDLSNMDSLLINTVKEMTQGVLLDKIYNEGNLNNILKIMASRRFEDGCIRPEYRRFRSKEDKPANTWNNRNQEKGQRFNNPPNEYRNRNQNLGNRFVNQFQGGQWDRNPYYQNVTKHNYSGQYRQNNNFNNGRINNFNRFSNSGNFQRPQTGNPRQDSGQYRQNPFRQSQAEPMEIDNIESNMSRFQLAGHPNEQIGQNRLISDRQSQERTQLRDKRGEEVNNCNFFYETSSECLPKIAIMINNKNYSALIDTGASFSLINSEIQDFPKYKLKDPILFSTISNKGMIKYEVCTVAPKEFNLPSNARVRWKAAPFTGRKYDFIIGIDILTFLNAKIKVEEKKIILNRKEIKFLNNPYNFNQVYALEPTNFNLDRLKLDHLNTEEYRFEIDYLKGKENRIADFLSRLENGEDSVSEETKDKDSGILGVYNMEKDDTMATIHSAEEDVGDYFSIIEEIVNKYKTQIIITNNKTEELKVLHGKRIIFIAERDYEEMGNIFRKYIMKGKIGIYAEVSDHSYNKVQEKLIEMYSNDTQVKFIKCTRRAQDIETEVEAIKQISLYHVKESMHSGIQETYNQIKNKIYFPKLMELIHLVINQCDVCKEVKYDRKPIKQKFKLSETPTDKNQIIHIDTFVMKNFRFLTIIDKFSKFGAVYPLNDRNPITIIEQLEDHFAKIGKPIKIIADNEFKAERIKEFLSQEGIQLHLTKPNSHTGNADVERMHNTLSEKFRIIYKSERNVPIKQLIQKAIRNYNGRYHSTIKRTPWDVQNGKTDIIKIKQNIEETKRKVIDKLNMNREEYSEKRKEGYVRNYKATRHKELPKFRKLNLDNIHPCNIKRPLKFADTNYDISTDMDRT